MKYFLLVYALTVIAAISILGFRGETSRKPPIEIFPDMDRQLKFLEQSESGLFSNGQSDRLPPRHSVPRGNALAISAVFSDEANDRNPGSIEFHTGLDSSGVGHSGFPPEAQPTPELMRLGQAAWGPALHLLAEYRVPQVPRSEFTSSWCWLLDPWACAWLRPRARE